MNQQQVISKECPNCGQSKYPFKKGICILCGEQVWSVKYVSEPKQFVRSNSPGEIKMGIVELYQGLDEYDY